MALVECEDLLTPCLVMFQIIRNNLIKPLCLYCTAQSSNALPHQLHVSLSSLSTLCKSKVDAKLVRALGDHVSYGSGELTNKYCGSFLISLFIDLEAILKKRKIGSPGELNSICEIVDALGGPRMQQWWTIYIMHARDYHTMNQYMTLKQEGE